jgi:hypothetical protein
LPDSIALVVGVGDRRRIAVLKSVKTAYVTMSIVRLAAIYFARVPTMFILAASAITRRRQPPRRRQERRGQSKEPAAF